MIDFKEFDTHRCGRDGNAPPPYFEAMGRYTQVVKFHIKPESQCVVTIQKNNSTIQADAYFARTKYQLKIDKCNPIYHIYNYTEEAGKDLRRDNVQVVGVTVGDIMRLFHFTKTEELPEEFRVWVKRALHVDSSHADVQNIVAYNSSRGLTLWDTLSTNTDRDFETFCRSFVYDDHGYSFFTRANNPGLVKQLLRFYLYGEDPQATPSRTGIITFAEPKSIPEVMQYIYDTEDDEYVLEIKQKLLRPVNSNQQRLLDTRYRTAVYDNLGRVPIIWPTWSLRNVYVKRWAPRDYMDATWRRDHMLCDSKYKFRSAKSDKMYDDQDITRWQNWKSERKHRPRLGIQMKFRINDSRDLYDPDDSDDQDDQDE